MSGSTFLAPVDKARDQGDSVVGLLMGTTVLDPGIVRIPSDNEFAQLLLEKPRVLTQCWHNNEPFKLLFLSDLPNPNTTRKCKACRVALPTDVSPKSPENLIISHQEVWEFPDRNGVKTWSSNTRQAFLHVRYGCILDRYPYYWEGMAKVDQKVERRLSAEQRKHVYQQLGISCVN